MITLDQRGRAGLQFLGSLQHYSSSALRDRAEADFAAAPEAPAMTQEFASDAPLPVWQQRIERAREVAERSRAYRYNRLYQRYVAEQNFVRGIPAVERKRAEWEAFYAAKRPADTSRLQLNPDLKMPEYYDGVEWHLEPGGWEGYDLYGAMFASGVGQYVFARGGYAAVDVDCNIREQRANVIRQFRNRNPKRVYEPGCGGFTTLSVCRQQFPNAELVGGDLAAGLLKGAHQMSEMLGLNITFRQEDARHVAEKDGSVDAVITYALHHEMPADVNFDTFREMYRILAPGGEIVISDPPPFRAVAPLQAVILDWETDNRAEPYFSEASALNFGKMLREIGFVDVEEYALEQRGYPWVTRARKPS
jgi:SAM-dependent methyltransferase